MHQEAGVNQDFSSHFHDSEKPSALTELASGEWAPVPGGSCRADRAMLGNPDLVPAKP